MNKINVNFEYTHEWIDHPLLIQFLINGRVFHIDNSGKLENQIEKKIIAEDGANTLSVIISGKNEANTVIDAHKAIEQDTIVKFKKLELNDINVTSIILNSEDKAVFHINGNPDTTLKKTMTFGFNGEFKFNFETPVYDWLLKELF